MSEQPTLLDVAPVPLATPAEAPLPAAWGRLMATHEKSVRRGLHPMGRPLGAEGTCGSCRHRQSKPNYRAKQWRPARPN